MMKKKFHITGMTCSSCQAHVERAVGQLPGVHGAAVNLLQNTLTAEYDEDRLNAQDIIAAVRAAGYEAYAPGEASAVFLSPQRAAKEEALRLKKRFFGSLLFLLPLLYVSMGHMVSLPLPEPLAANPGLFALTQFLLMLPVVLWNRKFFTNGFSHLFSGSPNMDSLIAIGAGAAVLSGVWVLLEVVYLMGLPRSGAAAAELAGQLYFESAAMILTLVTLGKWLEARAKVKTSDAISALVRLVPQEASVLRDGKEVSVPVQGLVPGDVIVVRAGERIAADGLVIEGGGAADESALTGESVPQDKPIGAELAAGTLLASGYVELRVERTGKDTVLALAPLAVKPGYQRQGVGAALIRQGHKIAGELGYSWSLVLGSETYYPKFGYVPAEKVGIQVPEGFPSPNFMAAKLREEAAPVKGEVVYAQEFGL